MARTSLYGLCFELPDGWVDWTRYEFRAEGSELRSVTFAIEPVPGNLADAWLLEKARDLHGLGGIQVGRIHRFQNPEHRARGFEASCGNDEPRQQIAFVLFPEAESSLTVFAKAVTGYLDAFKGIIASVQHRARSLLRPRQFPVYDWSFESAVALRTPHQFSFLSEDESRRFSVEWSDTQGEFADPDWPVVCQFPVDAKVTSLEKQETVLAAHSSEGLNHAAPQFRARTSTAVAEAPSEQVELLFAEAVAPHAGRFLRTRFSAQGRRGPALAEWDSILRSMKEEA